MDHWRLDEDDAAFEDAMQEREKQQRLEATRLHEESARFYQLARASQERPLHAKPDTSTATQLRAADKRKMPPPTRLNCVKVLKVAPIQSEANPELAESAHTTASAPAPLLPGMAAYDGDSDSGDDTS